MEGRRKKRKERTRMITGGLVTVYTSLKLDLVSV